MDVTQALDELATNRELRRLADTPGFQLAEQTQNQTTNSARSLRHQSRQSINLSITTPKSKRTATNISPHTDSLSDLTPLDTEDEEFHNALNSPESPDLSHLLQPSPPSNMTQIHKLELFRGDYSGDTEPHTWLRRLEASFEHDTVAEAKLYRFEMSLEPGRHAETWFQALPAADKADWKTLKTSFTNQWPLPAAATQTKTDLMETLLRHIDQMNTNMGRLVERKNGDFTYAHVAFVEDTKGIVHALQDKDGFLVPQARKELALELRQALPATATWLVFMQAIADTPNDKITDNQQAFGTARLQQPLDPHLTQLTHQFQNQSISASPQRFTTAAQYNANSTPYRNNSSYTTPNRPPLPSTTTPRQTTTGQQPPWTTATQQTLFSTPSPQITPSTPANKYIPPGARTPSTGGNFFNGSTARPQQSFFNTQRIPPTPGTPSPTSRTATAANVPTPTQLVQGAIAQAQIQMYEATDAGWSAYQAAMTQWEQKHPGVTTVELVDAPYPLRPGTACIGSRECYKCGMAGHAARNCSVHPDHQIPHREAGFRQFIDRMLAHGRNNTYAVAQIMMDDTPIRYNPELFHSADLTFEDMDQTQGNGTEEHV
ncbi:hypothetical protein D9619_011672 [Psilocybe cf. subviscida]|uniref:CCHC-type domain-containing protein n=1 Tax=Psilocybe cf. subviscida TaxID=2480587 RepID=A0A8H5BSC6_9AGAR|nr:hypothetical protein D9619_011672 [Psilocybe cf. subviscida]